MLHVDKDLFAAGTGWRPGGSQTAVVTAAHEHQHGQGVEELKTIEDSMRFAHVPADQLRMDVARALAALPQKHRQIILLRDLEELTISEIARRLSISVEAAKSLLRRARAAARTLLTESVT